jgi:hypothetical protein
MQKAVSSGQNALAAFCCLLMAGCFQGEVFIV